MSGPDPIGDYSALIDWGNGGAGSDTITAGTIVQNGTNFVILAPAGTPIVYPDRGELLDSCSPVRLERWHHGLCHQPGDRGRREAYRRHEPHNCAHAVQGQPLPQTRDSPRRAR